MKFESPNTAPEDNGKPERTEQLPTVEGLSEEQLEIIDAHRDKQIIVERGEGGEPEDGWKILVNEPPRIDSRGEWRITVVKDGAVKDITVKKFLEHNNTLPEAAN